MGEVHLNNQETKELAQMLMEFNFKLSHWDSCNYNKQFNKNGKSRHSLSIRQFHILIITYKFGFSTVSQYQNIMDISKSSLSLTVSKLVEQGYLCREFPQENDDGRKVYIKITQKGIDAVNEASDRVIEMFCKFYDSLDEVKKCDLKIGIEKLNNVFL